MLKSTMIGTKNFSDGCSAFSIERQPLPSTAVARSTRPIAPTSIRYPPYNCIAPTMTKTMPLAMPFTKAATTARRTPACIDASTR
eukprot:2944411-Prymnesium_polylepis.1